MSLVWLALALTLMALLVASHWSGYRRTTETRVKAVAELEQKLPRARQDEKYVSSNRCQSCHPGEHASWHHSYHRTMTQQALPENVLGKFDGTKVQVDGLEYQVHQRGETFWADMPDPDEVMEIMVMGRPKRLEDVPRVRRQVVLTTGSHHYQTYWVNSERVDTVLQTLPLVYLKADQRWIPRSEAFMRPPHFPGMYTQWNHHCIQCHSTGGIPGLKDDQPLQKQLQTEVGEFGISCEACHGPGDVHVARHQNPAVRYRQAADGAGDPTIVNPARLSHQLSSQICGQCHGVFMREGDAGLEFARSGDNYRPGLNLHDYRYYIEFPREGGPPEHWEDYQRNRDFFRERWWDDGTMLAGGREYSAMKVTGCYLRGEMSCASCHSMHDSDPADQLRTDLSGNASCVQCHQEAQYTTKIAEHTHHAPDSAGSDCMNCHMPRTTYALLGAIRNHQISRPDAAASIIYGTPNACNLCHLDQTMDWTQQTMARWYGTRVVEATAEQREIAASLLWLLKGHAAQRIIAAWHWRWQPARQASGDGWQIPFLTPLLIDPYGVVRYVAHRSLEAQLRRPVDYDFVGQPEHWREVVERVKAEWLQEPRVPEPEQRSRLLFSEDGQLNVERIQELLEARDNRPVVIKE